MRTGVLLLSAAAAALAVAPAALAKGKPDLTVRAVSKPPAAVERTAGFGLTVTVRNGSGLARPSATAFYLSRGKRKTRLHPDQAVPRLKARKSAVSTTTLVVPGSVPVGTYHVIACADATRKVRERSEANNCKAAPGTIKITAAKKPPAGKSSSELIDAAVASHKISAETGNVYKVFALFADPQLPPEFRGGSAGINESMLIDLKPQLGSMSAKVRSQLAPFYIPPYHAGSWWAAREGAAASASAGLEPKDAGPPCRALTDSGPFRSWSSYTTDSTGPAHFEVWYQDKYARTDDAKAKKFTLQLESKIFPELMKRYGRAPLTDGGSRKFCRGGDDNVDIAMVDDIGRSITIAYDDCQKPTPAYILLNRRNDISAVAHEVAHAFQFAFSNAKDCKSYDWWREADATDAEDQVYPDRNADGFSSPEQYNAHYFLDDPTKPLELKGGEHEYGAYLWPFFLRRMLGKTGIVQQVWENDEKYDSLRAIDLALGGTGLGGGFEGFWPKFALYNWNQNQFNYYEQTDGLVTTAHRSKLGGAIDDSARISVTPDGTGNKLLGPFAGLDHLSAAYYDFTIGAGTRTVAFSSFMTEPGHVEALGRLISSWYDLGDWSISLGADPQYFCRDLSTEQLNELVLIVSNSSYDPNDVLVPDTNYPPTVVATNIGCKKWTGSFSGSEVWQNAASGQDLTATWSGNATFERDPQFPTVLRLTNAAITWSKSGTSFSIGESSCTESAGPATLTAQAGDGQVELGVTNAKDPRRYHVQVLHVDDVPATLTCTGGGGGPFTEHPNPTWLGSGSAAEIHRVAAGGAVTGDSQATESDGGVLKWHWTFSAP